MEASSSRLSGGRGQPAKSGVPKPARPPRQTRRPPECQVGPGLASHYRAARQAGETLPAAATRRRMPLDATPAPRPPRFAMLIDLSFDAEAAIARLLRFWLSRA